jgi:arsenate reductase
MSTVTIYHNPRCSKSRQTLALLEENGIEPQVVLYLETPPAANELAALLGKLGIPARELLRKGEDDYKALGLGDENLEESALIDAMVSHPKLIERPIVVKGERAVLGRPPENVLELL